MFRFWNASAREAALEAQLANEQAAHEATRIDYVLITAAGTPKMGYLETSAYQRTVKVLLAGGSDPVIKKDPGADAWTHAVWDKAMAK